MLTIGSVAAAVAVALLVRFAASRDSFRGILLVLAFLLLCVGYSPAAGVAVSGALSNAAIAVLLVAWFGSSRALTPAGSLTVTIVFFAVELTATSVTSIEHAKALLALVAVAVAGMAVARACSTNERRIVVRGFVGVTVVEALLTAYEFFVTKRPAFWDYTAAGLEGTHLPNPLLGDSILRMAGTLGHPITLATVLATGVAILWTSKAEFSTAARFACTPVLLAGLLFTGTRSGFIAVALSGVFIVFSSRGANRVIRVGVTVVATALVGTQIWSTIQEGLVTLVDSGSWTNRLGSIQSAPDLLSRPLMESVFGSGFGSEESLFARGYLNVNGFNIVDNQLVTTLATQGVVGLGLLLALIALWMRQGDVMQRAAAIALVTMMFSFDYLRWAQIILLLFVVMSLPRSTASIAPDAATERPRRRSRRPRRHFVSVNALPSQGIS